MTADYDVAVAQHEVWVIEDSGAIVAALELIPETDTLLIENVAVDPMHQGKGLGKTLLAFAESDARRQGYTALRLYTNQKMTENIVLYGRCGYAETGRETLRGLDVVHMRKNLTQP